MKTKVYLAKSNRANPNHVIGVRTLLKGFDIEIVEFTGGKYSHERLLDCEMLIVIPELEAKDSDDYEWVPLGKGLHEQILIFGNNNNNCDTLILNSYGDNNMCVTTLDDFEVTDREDYVNYSVALLNEDNTNLSDVLENRFDKNNNSIKKISSLSRYNLLLIK